MVKCTVYSKSCQARCLGGAASLPANPGLRCPSQSVWLLWNPRLWTTGRSSLYIPKSFFCHYKACLHCGGPSWLSGSTWICLCRVGHTCLMSPCPVPCFAGAGERWGILTRIQLGKLSALRSRRVHRQKCRRPHWVCLQPHSAGSTPHLPSAHTDAASHTSAQCGSGEAAALQACCRNLLQALHDSLRNPAS